MSLEDWLNNGWLIRHTSSAQEIDDLLRAADRDLADCRAPGLSADWRLAIGHNSALMSATAALAASGYRAAREGYHFHVIQSLAHTIEAEPGLVARLDRFRKKRNLTGYERAGAVSEQEAAEATELAESLRQSVEEWLRANHPGLLGG